MNRENENLRNTAPKNKWNVYVLVPLWRGQGEKRSPKRGGIP